LAQYDEALAHLPLEAGPLAELQHHLLRGFVGGSSGDEVYAQTLLEGPFGSTVEDLLRSTGVAVLAQDVVPETLFATTYREWQTRETEKTARKKAVKSTNFLDPEAWATFSQQTAAKPATK
jgi:hypothetical protein